MFKLYWKKLLSVTLALTLILVLAPPADALSSGVNFSDVPGGAWYEDYLEKCTWLEIIAGYPDGSFKPDNILKRGEFIKMLAISAELYTIHNDTNVHWAQPYWNMLSESGVLENISIPLSYASLEQPITRYEMAALIRNTIYTVFGENTMELQSPETHITDYANISMAFRSAVEQSFAKGILTGYTDGSFHGDWNLTRAEATAVITRLLWGSERKQVSFATETVPTVIASDSFAFRYRNMSTAERRIALFGDENKTYFTSAADAGNHITSVVIQAWDINANGAKYTRTWTLYVNVVVADEVKAIFEEIYNNVEKFPIHSIGGARFSDTLRHSWGCAIDINPVENYYVNYSTGQQVGSYCYQNSNSPYCITPSGSVVQAFAKYGWGWGGQGWTSAVDYMHFSILSSGG